MRYYGLLWLMRKRADLCTCDWQVRMVIRCDNEAACRVTNGHCAASVAMGEALMMLEAIQCEFEVEPLAHHIAGEDNARYYYYCGRAFA